MLLYRRDYDEEDIFDGDNTFSPRNYLLHRLRLLAADRDIAAAENLLFETVEKTPCAEYLAAGEAFYADLDKLGDGALEDGGFSREEIAEGLADLRRISL